MSMLKREENMTKLGATLLLKQMTAYEQCKKANVMLTPPPLTLNRQPQEGQGTRVAEERIA